MKKLLRIAPLVVGSALFGACNCGTQMGSQDPFVLPHQAGSFQVQVTSVQQVDGQPLSPGDGGPTASWPFPFNKVILHVKAQALDERGQPYDGINHPVAIRITPGDLDPSTRTMNVQGGVLEGDVVASHVYGAVRLWVIDATADEAYAGGAPVMATPPTPDDAGYSHAAGVSQALYFARPSLVDLQRTPGCDPGQQYSAPPPHVCDKPDPTSDGFCHQDCECTDLQHFDTPYVCYQGQCIGACDNRLSPLTGDFVEVDEPYTAPDQGMIVTGITNSGFYVTDLSAQKMSPDSGNPAAPGFDALPGHFGHIFVYTYSAPADLYVGDHLIELTGSVQEFSGDTQLDFPGWVKVDQLPTSQYIPEPVPLTLAMGGNDATHSKTAQDLWGYYNSDMAPESLESAPVVIDHVTPSNTFVNCDLNGDGTLPLFANSSNTWKSFPDDPNYAEAACYIACTTGRPQTDVDGGLVDYSHYTDTIPGVCSELSTLTNFGQWEVVMADDTDSSGNVTIPSAGTRIGVQTSDALSNFNPQDLKNPEYQGVKLRIAGMLNQVQASRPRWIIYARDPSDVCCYPPDYTDGGKGSCPTGLQNCDAISGTGQ